MSKFFRIDDVSINTDRDRFGTMTFDYKSIPPERLARLDAFAAMACSTKQGVQHTYLAAHDIVQRGIPGAFVECGVAYGAMICAMAEAAREGIPPGFNSHEFHLFDSFEGIPMAGPNDHDQPGIGAFVVDQNLPLRDRLRSSGISASSVSNVLKNLAKHGFSGGFQFHKGWFQDTLPVTPIGPIAMLRLDGDLYESTKVCLEHLFDKIVPGGCLLLDDYPLPGSRKAWDEFCAARGLKLEPVIACDTGAAYFRI
jgi:hypothetical protein